MSVGADDVVSSMEKAAELGDSRWRDLVREHRDLVFHGGPGETLELRLFALADLVAHLEAAGFCDVRVRREPNFAHGVWWPGADGWPITARRPSR